MNYSVLRKFLSTTSLLAITATLAACSSDMERWGSPGYSGYTPNQQSIFTNSVRPISTPVVVNQPMPATVPVATTPLNSAAPVYAVPQATNAVPVYVPPKSNLITQSVSTAVRRPIQSSPMPPLVQNEPAVKPVYTKVASANQTVPVTAQIPVDYTATAPVRPSVLTMPPVVISRFHSLPRNAPRAKTPANLYRPAPVIAQQAMPVRVPVAAQTVAPQPAKQPSRFSISKFFSLPKRNPKPQKVDYFRTASIKPPAPIQAPVTTASIPVRQQVASAAPISVQNNVGVRTSGRWTSVGGTMITVRNGEDINVLSHRYGVPAKAIAEVNGLVGHGFVAPGQKLLIPVYQQPGSQQSVVMPHQAAALSGQAYPLPAVMRMPKANPLRLQSQTPYGQQVIKMQQVANASRRHMVMPGDTLTGVASRYGVSLSSLAQANGLTTNSALRMGQRLHIPPVAPANGIDYTTTASINPQSLSVGAAVNQPMPPLLRLTKLPLSKPRQIVRAAAPVRRAQPDRLAKMPRANTRKMASMQTPVGLPPSTKSDARPLVQSVPASGGPSVATTPQASIGAPKFRWPVRGRIISNYGRKTDGGRNDGINLAVPAGTSVRVAESGTVIYSGSKLKGYGNLVLVQHSNGWVTAYAHNEKVLVSKGQQVRRGQIIAQAGKTGNVDQPQLHFELRIKGDPVDPVPYLVSS